MLGSWEEITFTQSPLMRILVSWGSWEFSLVRSINTPLHAPQSCPVTAGDLKANRSKPHDKGVLNDTNQTDPSDIGPDDQT